MADSNASAPLNLGFLTVLQEGGGYLGGYLVTNSWGRPLEFRLSTAVQPNRVQQILYGGTLQPYICADLIGKTLVDKTSTPIQLILTDREPVLELRQRLEVPVVWVAQPGNAAAETLAQTGAEVQPATLGQGRVFCNPRFLKDVEGTRALLAKLDGTIDLFEPFGRIREAVAEARKSGITSRN